MSAVDNLIEELRRERDDWELVAAERARDDEAIIEGLQHQLKAMRLERDEARSERDAAKVTIEDLHRRLKAMCLERDDARFDRDVAQAGQCEVRDLRGKLAAVVAERDEARASRDVWELRALARSPTAVTERDAALGAAFSRIKDRP